MLFLSHKLIWCGGEKMETNNMKLDRIEKMTKLVAKLHLLDDKELSYVAGNVAGLVFSKKSREKENSKSVS